MPEQIIGDVLYAIGFISIFCILLGVGGIIADYILPRAPKLEKFLFGLFGLDPAEFADEEE